MRLPILMQMFILLFQLQAYLRLAADGRKWQNDMITLLTAGVRYRAIPKSQATPAMDLLQALQVTTGFKVRWLLIKRTDSGTTDNWALLDSERDSTNPISKRLFPNLSNAESDAGNNIDFLDDGFQPKNSNDQESNGSNYIYIAFADRPGSNWNVNNIVTNEGLTTSKTQFDVVTYSGTGSQQSISSLAFQPDLVWIKVS